MDILKDIMAKYSDDDMKKVGEKVGVNPDKSKQVVSSIAQLLTAKIAENASTPEGLKSLSIALEKHKDGGMLEKIKDLLDDNIDTDTDGKKILAHVFKDEEEEKNMFSKLAEKFDLDMGTIMKLLPVIAPMVMGALGKTKAEKTADDNNDGLSSMLGSVMRSLKDDKGLMSMASGMLGTKIKDDLIEKAKSSIMKKFLG